MTVATAAKEKKAAKGHTVTLYKADGTYLDIELKGKFPPGEISRLVGGMPELLHLDDDRPNAYLRGGLVRNGWVLVVNENGRNTLLRINQNASELWGSELVGDVLLCRRSDF